MTSQAKTSTKVTAVEIDSIERLCLKQIAKHLKKYNLAGEAYVYVSCI